MLPLALIQPLKSNIHGREINEVASISIYQISG